MSSSYKSSSDHNSFEINDEDDNANKMAKSTEQEDEYPAEMKVSAGASMSLHHLLKES